MDPLAAVGLVANIFQFISFGHELLSSAKEIYSSTHGVSKEVEQLKLLTLSVQENSKSIAKSALSHQDKNKVVLKGIAAECENIADELLKRLGKLEVKREHTTSSRVYLPTATVENIRLAIRLVYYFEQGLLTACNRREYTISYLSSILLRTGFTYILQLSRTYG